MKLWKRLAVLSLAITATFFGLFWITAFTTEEVAQLEHGKASFEAPIKATTTSFSKSSSIMDRGKITSGKCCDDWINLPAIDRRPASNHPLHRNAV